MKKKLARFWEALWWNWPARFNTTGMIMVVCGLFSRSWQAYCVSWFGYAFVWSVAGHSLIQTLRLRREMRAYDKSKANTVAELAKLMEVPPTATTVLIDHRLEQAEAQVDAHNRMVKGLEARWGTKKK